MKIFYFLIFLLFINNVSALTNLDNANTTELFKYQNNTFIDTNYKLSSNDSIQKFSIIFDSWNYPYSQTYRFFDSNNNTLIINFKYTEIQYFLQHTISRNVTVYYNNIPLLLQKKMLFNKVEIEAYEINDNAGTTNIFSNKDSLINIIDFSPKEITIKSNIFSTLSIVNNLKNTHAYLKNAHFSNKINLPFSDNTKFEFKEINIDYIDNGISKFQLELDESYNDLSFPFKFIFILVKAILKVGNIFNILSDIDYYEFQNWFITPLTILDTVIKTVIGILKFIIQNGILWFISISLMIIFIFCYARSKTIMETFEHFLSYSKTYFTYLIIKPILWIYEKILIKILRGA